MSKRKLISIDACLPLSISNDDSDLRIVGELHDAVCSMAYQGSEAWDDDGFILPHKKQAMAYAKEITKRVNKYPEIIVALKWNHAIYRSESGTNCHLDCETCKLLERLKEKHPEAAKQ